MPPALALPKEAGRDHARLVQDEERVRRQKLHDLVELAVSQGDGLLALEDPGAASRCGPRGALGRSAREGARSRSRCASWERVYGVEGLAPILKGESSRESPRGRADSKELAPLERDFATRAQEDRASGAISCSPWRHHDHPRPQLKRSKRSTPRSTPSASPSRRPSARPWPPSWSTARSPRATTRPKPPTTTWP